MQKKTLVVSCPLNLATCSRGVVDGLMKYEHFIKDAKILLNLETWYNVHAYISVCKSLIQYLPVSVHT